MIHHRLTTRGRAPRSRAAPWSVRRLGVQFRLARRCTSRWARDLTHHVVESRVGRSFPAVLLGRVLKEMSEDDATNIAASVSYYTILSLFPLILGVSAVIGFVAGSEARQDQVVNWVTGFLPGSGDFVRDSIQALVRFRGALGIAGAVGLLWTGSAVFGAIAKAVNRAWDVHQDRPFFKSKPRHVGMALGVGLLFAVSVGLSSTLHWATSIEVAGRTLADVLGGRLTSLVLELPALFISFGSFTAIYKFVPNIQTRWRDIWLGALVAGILFETAKNLFVFYLERFASYQQLYGNIASVVALMVWTYVSALILILGAEIASEYGRMKRGVRRGQHG